MVVRTQTSAAGILALLSEPEPVVKEHALHALIPVVPQFWAEVSEHIALMYVSNIPSFLFSTYLFSVANLSMKAIYRKVSVTPLHFLLAKYITI